MSLDFDMLKGTENWRGILAQFQSADFHHSIEFHEVSRLNGEGEPVLLTASDNGAVIMAWPMLIRQIPGSDLMDLGSVYGYPGPLFQNEENQAEVLHQALAFLESSAFVSVSARLHPIANAPLMEAPVGPDIRIIGTIVAADLSRERADLKREIRGAKNGTIKKIEKAGVTLRHSTDPRDTPLFQSIYQETMDRIEASPYYYFSDSYMDALLAATSFKASYVFAELDGQAIAAASIIETPRYAQYYLSGTATEHSRLSPMSLILRDQIFASQDKGLEWFVLGGGLGGQEDNLTKFKLGFSKTTRPAGLICKVLNPEDYTKLSGGALDATGFFPAYRAG